METNLSKLDRELENCGDSDDPEDKFKEVMSEFYNQAKEQSELLVEMFNNMTNMFKELADYYCFDLKKTQLEDFFGDLSSFLQQYENAKKDNIKRKEREEKERKAKERAVSFLIYSLTCSVSVSCENQILVRLVWIKTGATTWDHLYFQAYEQVAKRFSLNFTFTQC